MASNRANILVVGSLNTDLVTRTKVVPAGGETRLASSFTTGCGGKGFNQAVACRRMSRLRQQSEILATSTQESAATVRALGQDGQSGPYTNGTNVSMIGAVGDDVYGAMLRKELRANQIDDTYLQTHHGSSGVAVIIVEEDTGENRILVTAGANYKIHLNQLPDIVQTAGKRPSVIVLQLEIPISLVIETIDFAKENKIDVILNPAPAVELPLRMFKDLDHLILNMGEAKLLVGFHDADIQPDIEGLLVGIFSRFNELGVKNTIVTLGGDGVAFSTNDGRFQRVPAEQGIKVVDTTAAGDTFVGSYAASLARAQAASQRFSVRDAVLGANKAAAITVQREGAIASIPWRDELL